jgi:hypothetical protein
MTIHRRHPLTLAFALLTALAAAPPALARRSMTVRVPSFDVPAHANREICTFVTLPARETLDVGEVVILNKGGTESFVTHHLIVYAYSGDLAPLAKTRGRVVDDTACLNFGDGDPGKLQIVATSQAISSRQPLPRGTALRLSPRPMGVGRKQAVGLVLNSHWINGSDRDRRARAKVKFVLAKKHAVKRELKPIFEVLANGFLDVAPGATRSVAGNWQPGGLAVGGFLGGTDPPSGPACVTMLIGHMHRRGTLFTADFVDRGGARTRLYTNTVYADPPTLLLDPPLLVQHGERIDYRCTHDNATDPRLGCEEVPGVVPGTSVIELIAQTGGFGQVDGSAKLCRTPGANPQECPATDPAFPGRTFTGNCVPANLVFGFLSEDDMCILPGYYYDADAAAPPGQECVL